MRKTGVFSEGSLVMRKVLSWKFRFMVYVSVFSVCILAWSFLINNIGY
jgi:hypothetical protein